MEVVFEDSEKAVNGEYVFSRWLFLGIHLMWDQTHCHLPPNAGERALP